MKSTDELISKAYEMYWERIVNFCASRINDDEAARDLTQDLFLRLLEYSQYIYESQLENFMFTIARNLVNDYLRRHYVRREYDRYYQDYVSVVDNSVEHGIIARDIARVEEDCVSSLPRQRAAVYRLKRYEDMSSKDIAEQLGMAVRTVENHYYMGLRQVRSQLAECI